MSSKSTSFLPQNHFPRTPETAVRGYSMSSSYQMRILLWCTPYYAPLTSPRFKPMESLLHSLPNYARYVTSHDVAVSLISQGGAIHAFKPCCSSVYSPSHSLTNHNHISIGIVRGEISCLTQQICIPIRSTLSLWDEVRIFVTRSRDIQGPGVQLDISSSTLVFPVDTILLTGHLSTSLYMAVTGPHQNIKMARHHVTRFPRTCTTLETWSVNIIYRFASLAPTRYLPNPVPRNTKGSSSWSRLSPTWSKMTPGGALTWVKSFPVFPRSRTSSVHGSYVPELPVGMRFGRLWYGGLLAIGAGPWAMLSPTKQQFPSQAEQPCLLVLFASGFFSLCSLLYSTLIKRSHTIPAIDPVI
jgi:hypothetical protein